MVAFLGAPLVRLGRPLGHRWSDVLDVLDEVKSHFTSDVKYFQITFRYVATKQHEVNLQPTKANNSKSHTPNHGAQMTFFVSYGSKHGFRYVFKPREYETPLFCVLPSGYLTLCISI